METSVKFDFDGFTILADGYVASPGHCEGIDLSFEGLNLKDVPKDVYRIAKELAREELINSIYDSELTFS